MLILYFRIRFIDEVLPQELCKRTVMCDQLVIASGLRDFTIHQDNHYVNHREPMNTVGHQNSCLQGMTL